MKPAVLTCLTCLVSLGLLLACPPAEPQTKTGTPSAQGQPPNGPRSGQPGGPGAPGGGFGSRGPQTVLVIEAKRGDLRFDRETAGTVQPLSQTSVSPQIAGVVAQVLRRTGDRVAEGELVFKIDTAQLELALRTAKTAFETANLNLKIQTSNNTQNNPRFKLQAQTAEAALASAQKSRETTRQLAEIGGASASDLANADIAVQNAEANLQAARLALSQSDDAENQSLAQLRLAVQTAQVQVDQASLNLRNALVRAPFEGILSAVNVNPGQFVSTSQAAFVLVSPRKQIQFSVPPADAARFAPGTPATFTLDGTTTPVAVTTWPAPPVNGLVSLTAEPRGPLKAAYGQVGTLRYEVKLANGWLVPVTALSSGAEGTYLWLLADGKAKKTPVSLVGEAGTQVAVEGLTKVAVVIDSPPPGLVEGSAVTTPGQAAPEAKKPSTGAQPAAPAGRADAEVPAGDRPRNPDWKKRQSENQAPPSGSQP